MDGGELIGQIGTSLGALGILVVLLYRLVSERKPAGRRDAASGSYQPASNELAHALARSTDSLHELSTSLRALAVQSAAEHAEIVRALQALQAAVTSGARRGIA